MPMCLWWQMIQPCPWVEEGLGRRTATSRESASPGIPSSRPAAAPQPRIAGRRSRPCGSRESAPGPAGALSEASRRRAQSQGAANAHFGPGDVLKSRLLIFRERPPKTLVIYPLGPGWRTTARKSFGTDPNLAEHFHVRHVPSSTRSFGPSGSGH